MDEKSNRNFWGNRWAGGPVAEPINGVLVICEEIHLPGKNGGSPGLQLNCQRCHHSVRVVGTGWYSFKEGRKKLQMECPRSEENTYYERET